MIKTQKQLESRPPRQMVPEEALVLFVLDSRTPPVDDDFFDAALVGLTSGLQGNVWFGSWKVLRVPELRIVPPGQKGEKLQLPSRVVDEIRSWRDSQLDPGALRIVRISKLNEINAYAIVICMSQEEPRSEPKSISIGGKEYQEGQRMNLSEAEAFFRAIVSENPGPVTIFSEDASTGSTNVAQVREWSDFTEGPRTNKKVHDRQIDDLRKKGYLRFNQVSPGVLECKTAYRALTPQYFLDFNEFRRCQDIPDRYLQLVSSAPTCFVSHRWATLSHPDPSQVQFGVMRDFVKRNPSKLIWYDFSCLPQAPLTTSERSLFIESIRDLNSLVMVTNFVGIITEDYITRAWCFYEWAISRLFTGGPRVQIPARSVEVDFDPIVTEMVMEGKRPKLAVTKKEDMAEINELIVAGTELFRTLAFAATLSVLNDFGFSFDVGIASRFSRKIDFRQLWMIWQVLAGSSNHSGIQLPHLLDGQLLKDILGERHERFGTHARIYQELDTLSRIPLDLRIVEQESQDHLLSLMERARRFGPVPVAYTTLALVKLVYSFAVDVD